MGQQGLFRAPTLRSVDASAAGMAGFLHHPKTADPA